jgi:hypothetical protein
VHRHTSFNEAGLSSFEVASVDLDAGAVFVRRTHLGMRATPPLNLADRVFRRQAH